MMETRQMRRVTLWLFAAALSACSALSQPTATPTMTATPSATATPAPTETRAAPTTAAPTLTLTATASPSASATATPTATATDTATASFTPSITPLPVADYVFDNWNVFDISDQVKDGISNQMIAFISSNNQQTIRNIATAQPFTGIQTVYLASPGGARIPILEVESSARLEVFLARNGNALAFVNATGDPRREGLYVLDLTSGFSARILAGGNPLVQRGHYMPPDWSPDGTQLAMAVATGYDIDIYLYAVDGSGAGRTNITDHGAYDLWPRWSPDGRFLAFVSDRATCPSWIPGEPNFCDALTTPVPTSGQVYLYEVATGNIRQISNEAVSEPPYWINSQLLGFASGDPFDLLNPQRRIWRANITTGAVSEIRLPNLPDASYLSESWSRDGAAVLVQVADRTNRIVLMNAESQILGEDSDLNFPRFSMTGAWSPDGQRIAIGGSSGQCPYGIRVKNRAFRNIAGTSPPPSMCDPQYSPDGAYIAFTGVNPRVDGRNDIYVTSGNGYGTRSITSDLRGQVELVGWVGG